jgi:cell division protein FtsL
MSVTVAVRSRGGLSFAVIFLEVLPAALVVLMLATVGVLHVTSRVMVVRTGYALSRLDQRGVDLERENAQLKLELATLRRPARLEVLARTKLGLVAPPSSSIIHAARPR